MTRGQPPSPARHSTHGCCRRLRTSSDMRGHVPAASGASLKVLTRGAEAASRRCRTGCALIIVQRWLAASLSSGPPTVHAHVGTQ